jgi:hypothetical protein
MRRGSTRASASAKVLVKLVATTFARAATSVTSHRVELGLRPKSGTPPASTLRASGFAA